MANSSKFFVGVLFVGFGYMVYQGLQVKVPLSVYSAESKVEAVLNSGAAHSQKTTKKHLLYDLTAFKLA